MQWHPTMRAHLNFHQGFQFEEFENNERAIYGFQLGSNGKEHLKAKTSLMLWHIHRQQLHFNE